MPLWSLAYDSFYSTCFILTTTVIGIAIVPILWIGKLKEARLNYLFTVIQLEELTYQGSLASEFSVHKHFTWPFLPSCIDVSSPKDKSRL